MEGHRTRLVFLLSWFFFSALALTESGIIIAIYATRSVDSTTSTNSVLSFISALLSDLYLGLYGLALRQSRARLTGDTQRTRLEAACKILPRLLIILWVAACATGFVVAARQPFCLNSGESTLLWQGGASCRLHRAALAIAILALVAICALFCAIELIGGNGLPGFRVLQRPRADSSFGLTPSPSELSCATTVRSTGPLVNEKAGRQSLSPERAFWLQRQNSLSSRNAIYPPCLQTPTRPPRTLSGTSRSASLPIGPRRYWSYQSSHRSFTSTSTYSTLPSVVEGSEGSTPPTRTTSTLSTSSSSSSKSPLSTMRLACQPDVPIIPNRFLSAASSETSSRKRSHLPYKWSPSLHHAPLSADPAIRAFSTASVPTDWKASADTLADAFSESNGRMKSSGHASKPTIPGWQKVNCAVPQMGRVPPPLPRRARGHSIPDTGP